MEKHWRVTETYSRRTLTIFCHRHLCGLVGLSVQCLDAIEGFFITPKRFFFAAKAPLVEHLFVVIKGISVTFWGPFFALNTSPLPFITSPSPCNPLTTTINCCCTIAETRLIDNFIVISCNQSRIYLGLVLVEQSQLPNISGTGSHRLTPLHQYLTLPHQMLTLYNNNFMHMQRLFIAMLLSFFSAVATYRLSVAL